MINFGILEVFIFTILYLSVSPTRAQELNCTITEYDQASTVVKNCTDIIIDNLFVPSGKQLQLKLRPGTVLTFRGNTTFGYAEWKGPIFKFKGDNFTVRGENESVLDGQGSLWWDGLGSWGNITKPKIMSINATNALFENMNVLNCPIGCVMISGSTNVTVRNFTINISDGDVGTAPPNKSGHNTDGFGIGKSRNILVENCVVFNQDDCAVINSGQNITLRHLYCHGSHGLSISVKIDEVRDIIFEDSMVVHSENGIHIKTHTDAGKGLIKNVTYRNIIILDSIFFGINIQQNYQNLPEGVPQDGPPNNNVPIHDLQFINIHGTVEDQAVPVFILCADEGCFDWKWEGIELDGGVADNCTNFIPDGYDCQNSLNK